MKRNLTKLILTVFTLASAAFAGEMDLSADTTFVAKPKVKAAVLKQDKAAPSVKAEAAKFVGPLPANTQWVQTMEASMGPLSSRGTAALTSESGYQPIVLWLGWAFAGIFGGVLLSQGLRTRRRYQDMIRAGNRDDFYLPPSNRHRF